MSSVDLSQPLDAAYCEKHPQISNLLPDYFSVNHGDTYTGVRVMFLSGQGVRLMYSHVAIATNPTRKQLHDLCSACGFELEVPCE